ncbi:DUF637 domain-containing protein [Pseudomonas sp. CDFA 553]|nr:DUF637 domain-containing protein [Pseudomonas quasicaspiana]MCD5989799.1 DUF637 domain-containing protein [Pseudomonas quasicaspiana]
MVKADPQLAWLKEAEKRGDVDWRQVKEIHESFKYNTSGLGPASQLIIAIMLSMVMGPMMAGWTTMAQAGTIAVATKATVSTIDNRGNLGAVFKDVTSTDSLKGYAVAMATAGVADGLNYSPGTVSFNPESLKIVAMKVAADAAIKTAVYGGSFQDNLASSLAGTAASIGGAYGAGKIGDLGLVEGSLEKIALHAALGGLLAEAMGGDFRTGAIAGGANEALVGLLGSTLLPEGLKPGTPEYLQAQANLVALSKIVGVLGAAASNGDINVAAEVAANATQNNYLNHTENNERFKAAQACKAGSQEACVRRDELNQLDEDRDKALRTACDGAAMSSACTEKRLEAQTARIDLLKHKNTPEAREQIQLAFKDPELINYTLLLELRSNQKLENAVVEQIATSIGKSLLSLGADMTPVIGDVKAFSEAEDNWDYLFASIGILPGVGDALSKGLREAKALLKEGKAQEASELLEKLAQYEGGAKGISPVVTAEGKIGDAAFTDVNQTARPVAQANPDEPTLIADRVTAKTEATGKSLPNGNMADAHAEIGVIQQAYNAGKTQGADMAMSVAGKDVCGFCKGDIAAAAEKSGLSSLTIQAIDDVTGLPKKYNWVPGMRSIKEVP